MSKYTPGPWRFKKHAEGRYFGNIIGTYPDGTIRTITIQTNYGPADENSANARLIAAAPELLEALKAMKTTYGRGNCPTQHDAYAMAESAIAKAERE